ncbi:MAG: SemiSWEET transporter [Candidatus Omnitrophica bacterium]|nr:SemiSWEET transporter [Candidatus Omnitrophota bacterium]
MSYKIVGLVAAFLTMFSFVPQIVKIVKTKSAHDVSIIMLFQLSIGALLWLIYGLSLRDIIIVLANGVTLLSLLIILVLYQKYGRKRNTLCQ